MRCAVFMLLILALLHRLLKMANYWIRSLIAVLINCGSDNIPVE